MTYQYRFESTHPDFLQQVISVVFSNRDLFVIVKHIGSVDSIHVVYIDGKTAVGAIEVLRETLG